LAAPPVSRNGGRASAGDLNLAPLFGPLVVAAAIPLVFLHVRYQPTMSFGTGGTSVDVRLSDLAVLAVALSALAAAVHEGWRPLRRGVPVWVGGGAFLLLVLVSISYPVLRGQSYDWQARLVAGLKLCEYATLALAAPLLLRTRGKAVWPLRAVISWSALATGWAALQFAGAVNEFEGKRPGQREPSFVGIHDLAALSGAALVLWLVTTSLHEEELVGRRWAVGGAVAGAAGIVLSGSMVAVIGLWLAAICVMLVARARERLRRRAVVLVAAVVLVVTAGTALMRGSTLEAFASFLGVKHEKTTGVQSYAHRTLLAYIGLRIWLDHPVTGAGFQATYEQFAYGPQLAAAHRRFPDEPEQAFPSPAPDRQWGVQNLYVDTLACLGVIGFLLLAGFFGATMSVGLRGSATSALALVGIGWLLVTVGVWIGIGLVSGIPLVALTWLGAGLATSRV
jgi:hypothetical protein